ncbi:TonB family protein [Pyxidicoccus parkwayensis]|uniref:TonB family protein n=1 Tax=Pyxidicoccus parkwayensis TaxID=2813578 RepID=A0ABX7NZ49_9BACT|nr:energy transducer TonB [Pyxidicoccus parkwaysis]QSQ24080.1 TonB family protein [Pyxidicoccus parkwaysis]
MSPAPSRRLLFALAASLGVHGLLWLLLGLGETRTVGRAPETVTEVASRMEWVEVEVDGPSERARLAEQPSPVPSTPRATEPAVVPNPTAPSEPQPAQVMERPRSDASRVDSTRAAAAGAAVSARSEDAQRSELPSRDEAAQADLSPTDLPRADAPRVDPVPSPTSQASLLPMDAPRADSRSTDTPRADAPRADLHATDIPHAEPTGARLLLATRAVTPHTDRSAPVAVLDAGVPDPYAPPTAQDLVQDLVAEGVGRGKVERGLVHPYFSQLGKVLVKVWDADRSVKEHGLQGYFDMGMERGRAYSRIWMERAEHYGSSGSFGAKDTPESDRRRPVSTVGDPTLRARQEMRTKMREEFRATRRATIRVEQDTQGRLLDVRLVNPSHQPEVDQEAIKDVRTAAEKLPPPPPEAVGSRERIVSIWQFELIISISPPIPTFTFEFDEALGFIDTRLPLDKRIYKRVRLVEIR